MRGPSSPRWARSPPSPCRTPAHAACPGQPVDQTFLPWLDLAYYQEAPDSGFEDGGSWTLAGGAAVVAGNQPFLAGARSLDLPAGSSATTAPICVTVAHPTIRFFARNTGSALAPLTVTVQFKTLLGLPLELPVGVVLGGASGSRRCRCCSSATCSPTRSASASRPRRAARGRSTTSTSTPTARAERAGRAAPGRRAGGLRPPPRPARRGGRRCPARRGGARPRRRVQLRAATTRAAR